MAVRQAEADGLSAQIGQHEARARGAGGGGAALRAEYQVLEKSVGGLRREKENLQQDLEISSMNPKEVSLVGIHRESTRRFRGGGGQRHGFTDRSSLVLTIRGFNGLGTGRKEQKTPLGEGGDRGVDSRRSFVFR